MKESRCINIHGNSGISEGVVCKDLGEVQRIKAAIRKEAQRRN